MDEDVKNSLALDVLVNNEKVNVIQLSGKLNLPLPACSRHLEGWLNACPEKEKISKEYLVREEDKDGNIFFRFVSGDGKNKEKEGSASFLFSLEKNHESGLSSSIYHGGNSSYKRIKLTSELRKGKVPVIVPEAVKEAPKEVVVKKEEPKGKRENIVSKFFSEKPKEKPKEEAKETKSDSGSDKDSKNAPPAKKPPVKVDKKPDGKFKGKTAPVGSRAITSFFTKVPKSVPAAPQKTEAPQKEKEEPEKPVEVAKKRPLADKSPVQERKSPPKRKKLSRKPKIKAGTSRILQIVDEDSSDSEEERIDREEVEEKQENQDVRLENEQIQEKTPPRPKKKKKIITECFKDEDGYDNVTFREVDCSSEE